jgi:hypothetical protein
VSLKQHIQEKKFVWIQVFLITVMIMIPILTSTSCAGINSFVSSGNVASKFDVKLADIGFKSSAVSIAGLVIGADTLTIPGDNLNFSVDVVPKYSFTGEPFSVSELGNKDIGFKTVTESRPYIYLAIFSRDGYYFHATGPLIWTKDQLELPDNSERDYYKTQSIINKRGKHVIISVPSSDKAVVSLLHACNELMKKMELQQWNAVAKGDWFSEGGSPVWDKMQDLFNKYFTLKVIDKDEWRNLEKQKTGLLKNDSPKP